MLETAREAAQIQGGGMIPAILRRALAPPASLR